MMSLFMAQRLAVSGDIAQSRQHLSRALNCAVLSNNRLLLQQVDQIYGELDPRGLADRLAERFSGRPIADLRQTVKEDATIVFADLVSFTALAATDPRRGDGHCAQHLRAGRAALHQK